ncbi:MAG: glycosyltransferase family 2 protein [Anaerolineaceae bacterium]|nr:MAG: glycosyltransferase family 2 protein [Anaerolineaceae bacterium]
MLRFKEEDGVDEHNIQVSIIMPVYNVEKYLRQCLDSLFSQTLQKIEIIAVNDGSTDNCLQILEEYQSKNPQIMRIYTTENKGVSHARNYGMKKASGDYILFVDSDDFIEKDMCEKLYNKAILDDNDIVICTRYNVYEDMHTGMLKREHIKLELINSSFNLYDDKYELAHILPFPWDKLFKRELLTDMEFPLNMRFEDLVFVYKVVVKAKNIGIVNEPLYNYRKTTQGGFLNTFSKQTLDIIKAFELVFDYMEKNNYMEHYYDELEYTCARHFLYRYITLFKNENRGKGKLDIKLEIINKTQDFLDSRLPNWRNNHYLMYSSGWLKKKLPLFINRKKMVRITRLREYMPNRIYDLLKRGRNFLSKLNKFRKSKSKMSKIKKKLPFISVMMRRGYVYYTHVYEKLNILPNDIFLESKHGEDIAGNIFALLKELSKDKYKAYNVKLAITPVNRASFRKLLEDYDINKVDMVDIYSRDYDRVLASAKYLITDTSFPPYFIKKPDQIYLNTWHGTPLKAMGRIVPNREYALGNIQRNFMIADYLLFQNNFSRDVFMRDYMIKGIYPGEILVSGYPRNSLLLNDLRRDYIRNKCNITNKRVIVYMPTWRGLLTNKDTDKQLRQLDGFFADIDSKLDDSDVFYVKLHPYVKDKVDYSGYSHIREIPASYETYDFLTAADVLVTDYSSIMFDFGVTGRKMILFAYDKEEYLNDRGLYLDLDELGLPITESVDELILELKTENKGYARFYESFCINDKVDTPEQICNILIGNSPEAKQTYVPHDHNLISEEDIPSNDRKKILIFMKGFKDDIESRNRINMINSIDTNNYDVYICMKTDEVKKDTHMLSMLNSDISYIPILYEVGYRRSEYFRIKAMGKIAKNKVYSRCADRIMTRERRKYFGDVQFDYIIHYSCLEHMVLHLCLRSGDKAIYNFKHFSKSLYQKNRSYRRTIKYIVKQFPAYDLVIAGNGAKTLKLQGDNIIYSDQGGFSMKDIINQLEGHK